MRHHPKGSVEALTGARAGQVLNPVICEIQGADAFPRKWKATPTESLFRETLLGPAGSETLCMFGIISRENREIHCPPWELALRDASGSHVYLSR